MVRAIAHIVKDIRRHIGRSQGNYKFPIRIDDLSGAVIEHSGLNKIEYIQSDMDESVINSFSRVVRNVADGSATLSIFTSSRLSYEWKRFAIGKELVSAALYAEPNGDITDTSDGVSGHARVNENIINIVCLEIFFPTRYRILLSKNNISEQRAAEIFRIPASMVALALSDEFIRSTIEIIGRDPLDLGAETEVSMEKSPDENWHVSELGASDVDKLLSIVPNSLPTDDAVVNIILTIDCDQGGLMMTARDLASFFTDIEAIRDQSWLAAEVCSYVLSPVADVPGWVLPLLADLELHRKPRLAINDRSFSESGYAQKSRTIAPQIRLSCARHINPTSFDIVMIMVGASAAIFLVSIAYSIIRSANVAANREETINRLASAVIDKISTTDIAKIEKIRPIFEGVMERLTPILGNRVRLTMKNPVLGQIAAESERAKK